MKKLLTALVFTLSTAALAEQANPQTNTQAQQEQKRTEGRRITTGVDAADVGPAISNKAKDVSQKVTGGAQELAGWKEVQDASHIRTNGGTPPDKQVQLAQFLCSERSNHISGKLIGVGDDWKKLEHHNAHAEIFTLRRLQRV